MGGEGLIGSTRALACVWDVPAVTVCPASTHEGQQRRLLNLFLDRHPLTTDLKHAS